MYTFDNNALMRLLPAVHRLRDEENGDALRELLSILGAEASVVEENISQLYDDQFIETCAEWVAPYIGVLVGYTALDDTAVPVGRLRSEVADTIGNRRRKGTLGSISRVVYDCTGWHALAVEFFQRLRTTQYTNHVRPDARATPDIRDWRTGALAGTPYDALCHTADVRQAAAGIGQYNIPTIGIYYQRSAILTNTLVKPRRIHHQCFTFDQAGFDVPLYRSALAGNSQRFPGILDRLELHRELETLRHDLVSGMPRHEALKKCALMGDHPVFVVTIDGAPVAPEEIGVDDLSGWNISDAAWTYSPRDEHGATTESALSRTIRIVVDPECGRFIFTNGIAEPFSSKVRATFATAFSLTMGGGEYARNGLLPADATVTTKTELLNAITALNGEDGIISVDCREIATALTIAPAAGQHIILQARDGRRPLFREAVTIESADDAGVTFSGFFFAKRCVVAGGKKAHLIFRDCTLIPHTPSAPDTRVNAVIWNDSGAHGSLILDKTISGALLITGEIDCEVTDSIVDARADTSNAIMAHETAPGPAGTVSIIRSTVRGKVHAHEIDLVENSLITGMVTAERTQHGCIRYSYLPFDSHTPGPYRCMPDWAVTRRIDQAMLVNPALTLSQRQEIIDQTTARVRPGFTNTRFGTAAYLRLHQTTPAEITQGSGSNEQMGVFHNTFDRRKMANALQRLGENLRIGLDIGMYEVP